MQIEKDVLEKLIIQDNLPYTEIGKMYGVSSTMIKKTAIKLGIDLPKRRNVNQYECFLRSSFSKKSRVFQVSDTDFIAIIATAQTWVEISTSLGYNSVLSSSLKKAVEARCSSLNIKLNDRFYQRSALIQKTKGETFSKAKTWQVARSSIQKDARQVYFDSVQHACCVICGYDKHVEVAHIKSVSSFDDNATIGEINDITNLVGLCPNHHWEFDNGLIDVEIIQSLQKEYVKTLAMNEKPIHTTVCKHHQLINDRNSYYNQIKIYYENNEVSITETAKEFNCSRDTVKKVLKLFNIQSRKVLSSTTIPPRKVVCFIDEENSNIIFDSTAEGARWLLTKQITQDKANSIRSKISLCAKGKIEKAYGYKWKYADEYLV